MSTKKFLDIGPVLLEIVPSILSKSFETSVIISAFRYKFVVIRDLVRGRGQYGQFYKNNLSPLQFQKSGKKDAYKPVYL